MRQFNYDVGEFDQVYHKAAVKLGLSDSAMSVLYALQSEGGSCPITDICRLTGTSKQTLNSALRKMEKDGTVILEAEGKKKTVKLTHKGKSAADATVQRLIEAENKAFGIHSEKERSEYLRMTRSFLSALKKEIEDL